MTTPVAAVEPIADLAEPSDLITPFCPAAPYLRPNGLSAVGHHPAQTSGVSSSGTPTRAERRDTGGGYRGPRRASLPVDQFTVLRCLYGPDEPGMGLVPDSFR
jgi:hypothetical protein